MPKTTFERFCAVLWTIWNNRNTLVHGGKLRYGSDLADFATAYLEEFQSSSSELSRAVLPSSPSSSFHWFPLQKGKLKLNSDALKLRGEFSVLQGELVALREGLKTAATYGLCISKN
ncbi:hypothetical protein TorRG33x02_133110 [Trema orientale]|uniref:Uncharacterized protein n=1 Tax=Trema orientale TaxID=63057 RepID=A0A2P5EZD6_TREOI|nr:hypothetical protein TorRG33x02_133110 [Trema orientale]